MKAAQWDEFARLSKQVFPKLKIGLLHGRLSSEEKEYVHAELSQNETQILVATTVGRSRRRRPNATAMVIEHAERFGLSQFISCAGRIGRGADKSH